MNSIENPQSPRGTLLLKIATLYLMFGLILGTAMAVSHQFQLRPVHTHINLLGWATMALAGLVYCMFPRVAASPLARWHFWLHNLGLPIMMLALAAYSLGAMQFKPLIAIGAFLVTSGLIFFTVSVFLHVAPFEGVNARKQAASIEIDGKPGSELV